jgi:GWxTD domain-containing protein
MHYLRIPVILLSLVLVLGAGASYSNSPADRSDNRDSDRVQYYKKWLEEDVVYIISEEEKKVFKDLTTDEECESFIEQFWARRDPDPRTGDNPFKEEHYRRIAYANERFTSGIPGWKTDRGRVYIMYGQPDELESHPTGGAYNRPFYEGGGTTTTYPFEKWWYRHIDGLGDDIEIEFVDPSMTGEYRMAMTPDEKDALLHVPNAGLTLAEEMGLSDKADRPYFNPSAWNDTSNPQNMFMRAKDNPFSRMEQYFGLQRPPEIKFEDLKAMVKTRITYSTFPYTVRTDFIRLSSDRILVPITIEINNRDLEFKKELDFNRALVNVYGIVTNLTGRIMCEFEDEISTEYLDEYFEQGKNKRSQYQKIIALPPGQRYKLDLVLKDVNGHTVGPMSIGLNVPEFDGSQLMASSIILANSVTNAPKQLDRLQQYVLGDLKVVPNAKSEYLPGQNLIPYMQVYNVAIDQTNLKPSVEVTFTVKKDGKILDELKDMSGSSMQFFSGERVVVLASIPLKEVSPGEYSLAVTVLDKITGNTLTNSTDFKVKEPVQAISAVTQ